MQRMPFSTALTHRSEEGTLTMYEPVVGLLVFKLQGFVDIRFHYAAMDLTERCVGRTGRVRFFFDRLEQEDESAEYAKQGFIWLRENSSRIDGIHVLQPSWLKNVSGAAVASLLGLPPITATASREKFERDLEKAIDAQRRGAYSLPGSAASAA